MLITYADLRKVGACASGIHEICTKHDISLVELKKGGVNKDTLLTKKDAIIRLYVSKAVKKKAVK
ncbi:hypothetical protein LO80_03130 [Candidatus Francisella endociliophora]|uniref:Uncharacterized protein n=1 Tax=Candidatus Francisella endociliophora TaxID=653937 RepID=A0A097ENC4_9GAMM|nr:hypothetical protein [Francisella sp. FSC1006]AIT09066.1 hypothetical protein LO80_03130 [Francisella sp. FSC1006]